jgi:hypothetical protein
MLSHEHLPEIQKRLQYRITYIKGYFDQNGEIDTLEKLRGLDLPELIQLLEPTQKYIEANHAILFKMRYHILHVIQLLGQDADKRWREFDKDYESLLKKLSQFDTQLT